MSDDVYQSHNALLKKVDSTLKPGEEFNLRGITIPHYEVRDTALAACLATLDIPFREPGAYTDSVDVDDKGNEAGRAIIWWLADGPRQRPGAEKTAEEIKQTRTEWLIGAWRERARFEADHPLHPLVAMRAGIDARAWWLAAIDAWRRGQAIIPIDVRGDLYATEKIAAAAVLKACGFAPRAFNGRAFLINAHKDGVHAEQILAEAAKPIGGSPPQWMHRAVLNVSHLAGVAKRHGTIIRQRFDDQCLLLTADATRGTRDKFHGLL